MALHDGGDFWGHVSTGREGAVSNCSWDSQTSGTGGGWESRSNSLLSFVSQCFDLRGCEARLNSS